METEDRCAKVRAVNKELTEQKQVFSNFDEEIKGNRNKIRGQETRIETLEYALKGAHEANENLATELAEAREWGEGRVSPTRFKDLQETAQKPETEDAIA
jgi:predicted  nucleic acid-binding Zn-ribbon protein